VKLAHDGIAGLVHASVRLGLRSVPAGGGHALALAAPEEAAPLADSPGGALALGAVNGMWGDRIARDHAPLALGLDLRVDGELGERVAVFVHGLCETDTAWRLGGGPTYGERLRADLRHTPVYARYNTGRHISDNGRALAAALEALVAGWPVAVEELVLVGHSMGGLVARSACHYGEYDGMAWTERLRHVVCLGSPHMGAPLERAAARGSHLLARLPETAPLARLLTVRSAGVKDLRYGACLEEDWKDVDPDEWGPDRCADFPFLPSATYYYVGATVARDKDSPLGRMIGDVLVQFPSASGDGPLRKLAFEIDHGLHLGGVNHLQLLNHPRVYDRLLGWLRSAPALTAG
jgi:pimeloyl-ACP methyl ester carboxylesterase